MGSESKAGAVVFSRARLTGKTYDEVSAALIDKTHDELVALVFSLVTVERLWTPAQVARASQLKPRDVLADMRAGRFVDPIFGAGFFCRASNSFRVSGSAVQAWRRAWFVPVLPVRAAIPAQKKIAGQNGVDGTQTKQRAGSPGTLVEGLA